MMKTPQNRDRSARRCAADRSARPPADLVQPPPPGHDSSARQTGATVCALRTYLLTRDYLLTLLAGGYSTAGTATPRGVSTTLRDLRRARPSGQRALVQLLPLPRREDEHGSWRKDGLARAAARKHRDRPGHC